MRFSRFRSASAVGRWNFAPMNFSHPLSSCAVVVISRPSAPFDGLQLVRLSLHFVHVVSEVVAAGYRDCPSIFSSILFAQLVEVSATLFKQQFRALEHLALPEQSSG